MKKIIQIIVLACITHASYSQFIGNLETTFGHKNSNTDYSVGASLQYLFYFDYYFLPGINAGVSLEMNDKSQVFARSIPINVQARYYVVGRHSCCGGGYLETNAGVKLMKYFDTEEGPDRTKNVIPQINIGLGYRFPMSFDYQFRIGYQLDEGTLGRYIGFRFGYTF